MRWGSYRYSTMMSEVFSEGENMRMRSALADISSSSDSKFCTREGHPQLSVYVSDGTDVDGVDGQ